MTATDRLPLLMLLASIKSVSVSQIFILILLFHSLEFPIHLVYVEQYIFTVLVVSTGSSRTTSIDGPHKIKILEEPQSFGYRFRYQVEGSAHGGLQGANTRNSNSNSNSKAKKTYPDIKVSLS